MKVLFVADGSLSNPILQSQGIPQLLENVSAGAQCGILSFENPTERNQRPDAKARYEKAFAKLQERVAVYEVTAPFHTSSFIASRGPLRAVRFFLMLFIGFFELVAIVRKHKYTVVHCRGNYPALLACLAKGFSPIKVLYDSRGMASEETRQKGAVMAAAFERKVEDWLLKRSDHVVVVSGQFRDYLDRSGRIASRPPGTVSVIPNGFSSERFPWSEELRAKLRREAGLDDKLVMLYSGSLSQWHKFGESVLAFRMLLKSRDDAFFLIASFDGERVKEYLLREGIDENRFRIVNATGDEIGRYLITADFGMLFREKNLINRVAWPIKYTEYLAAGLPALHTAEIGDLDAVTSRNGCGVIIHDLDSGIDRGVEEMINLLDDASIHANCRQAAEKELRMEQGAAAYLEIYRTLSAV